MNTGISQKLAIFGFTALFFVMYFGCDVTSTENKLQEKSREIKKPGIDIEREIENIKRIIPKDDQADIELSLIDLEESSTDEQKVSAFKKLAGKWYALGYPLISGHYAAKLAEIDNTEEAYGIAGTTNYLAMKSLEDADQRKYAQDQAILALDKAISLNPQNVDHKINKALCFVESEAPMQGIMMLRELSEQHPNNEAVQIQLGRLSIRTNQWEKALERFERVLELNPDNKEVHCYLVDVYKAQNDNEMAEKSASICQTR